MIEKKKYNPEEFKVKSQLDSLSSKDKVFADWFTGVIIGEERNKKDYWKVEKSYYFYVKYGKVVDKQVLTEKDFKQIEKISEKDTSNHDLTAIPIIANVYVVEIETQIIGNNLPSC